MRAGSPWHGGKKLGIQGYPPRGDRVQEACGEGVAAHLLCDRLRHARVRVPDLQAAQRPRPRLPVCAVGCSTRSDPLLARART